jgi:hypothetical protein
VVTPKQIGGTMIKITKTDTSKETEGVWTEYEGVKVLVARMNNASFLRALREKSKSTVEGNLQAMATEKSDALMIEVMAEHILLGWKPFDFDGQTIEHNRENAISLLTHDPDFRDFISDFSRNVGNFMQDSESVVGK